MVVPYWKVTVAVSLLAFTVPFRVALVVVTEVAGLVVTVGAALVVKDISAP